MNSVAFASKLDTNLIQIANNTHTWLKDATKFAVVYKTAFWKEKGLSGVGFSNVDPFTEIHDHSNFENDHFVLMGFLNPSLTNKSQSDREENIREQLFKFFGEEGEKVAVLWRKSVE